MVRRRVREVEAVRGVTFSVGRGELYGLPGILVALPFLAVMRALWEFFGERVQFEPWKGGEVPVEVEVAEERPVKPVPPEEPPEAKVAP